MSFINFNKEQKMILVEIKRFATTELEPIADEIEKNAIFPKDIIGDLFELGLLSLIIPEKYGGVGLDLTSLCIAVEELSKVCASIGTILVVNNCMVAYPLMKYGEDSQKELYLNKLSNGEIGGFICEPEIDLPEDKNEIKNHNNDYTFSGCRDFVLNGEAGNFFIMPVSINELNKFYLINDNTKGLNITKPNLLGIRAAGISCFKFEEILLKDDCCFSLSENYEKVQSEIIDLSNICFSAISLGLAQADLEASIKYSKERKQFGRFICEFPMVQEMIAKMKINIETARLLVYDAASKYDSGQNYSLYSNIARIYCGDIAVISGLDAIQIHGGYGYIKDYPVERYFRDAKMLQALNFTPHIIKTNIAKELLK